MVRYVREFMKFDQIFFFISTFFWLALSFWDLKKAGMLAASWVKIVVSFALSLLVLGPGATAGLGWLWREDAITNKRHKGAITAANWRKPAIDAATVSKV
jgi:hypothetical protein